MLFHVAIQHSQTCRTHCERLHEIFIAFGRDTHEDTKHTSSSDRKINKTHNALSVQTLKPHAWDFVLTFAFASRIMEKTQCKLFTFGSRIYAKYRLLTTMHIAHTWQRINILHDIVFFRNYRPIYPVLTWTFVCHRMKHPTATTDKSPRANFGLPINGPRWSFWYAQRLLTFASIRTCQRLTRTFIKCKFLKWVAIH